jgi:hypothetical protein
MALFYRAIILRRRFRRRIEEAIAAGVLLPEQVDALWRRGPAPSPLRRPKMWEMQLSEKGMKGMEWDDIVVR